MLLCSLSLRLSSSYAECRYAECRYAECRYAECHYAECRYVECRGALLNSGPGCGCKTTQSVVK
jgi:hypothetical protein